MHCPSVRRSRGVTLVEMVIVIAISAIIAGAVAVFIARPIEGYADATRRAELTDIADTALRRMTRDLRTALPNSIRIAQVESPPASGNFIAYLEYLQTRGGGRYRAELDRDGAGNPLNFAAPDASFDVIGTPPPMAVGNVIVVYNLNSAGAVANAYNGDNRRDYVSGTSTVTITPTALALPFASPGNRFQVVEHAVTYECNPTSGQLRRYWNYGIVDTPQPTPPATANNALLATEVSACAFTYTSGTSARTGIVTLDLTVQRGAELIRLFQQVHVSNAP